MRRKPRGAPSISREVHVHPNNHNARQTARIRLLLQPLRRQKLAHYRKAVFQKGINLLMKNPESSDALTHLPHYLYESGDYTRLLDYLSAEHIGKLIDCTQSWTPLHQKVDLAGI